MSEWYEIEDDDIDIEDDVAILVHSNDFGNVYATLTFKQIEEIYKKINSKEEIE